MTYRSLNKEADLLYRLIINTLHAKIYKVPKILIKVES